MQRVKRWLAGFLAVTILAANLPVPAFAENEDIVQPTPAPSVLTDDSVPAEPEVTPAPQEPSEPEPAVTPEPAVSPEPSVNPEPAATPVPEATATPEPTAAPEPTVTPEPDATPEPTATPEPDATPEPTVTPEPAVPNLLLLGEEEPEDPPASGMEISTYYTGADAQFTKQWNDGNNPNRPNLPINTDPSADCTVQKHLHLRYLLTDKDGNTGSYADWTAYGEALAGYLPPAEGEEQGEEQPEPPQPPQNNTYTPLEEDFLGLDAFPAYQSDQTNAAASFTFEDELAGPTLPQTITLTVNGEERVLTVSYQFVEDEGVTEQGKENPQPYLSEPIGADGHTIRNTLTTTYTSTVAWLDNQNAYKTRPDPETYAGKLSLWRKIPNGEWVQVDLEAPLTVNELENETYAISAGNLPAYDENGEPYTYAVKPPEEDSSDTADTTNGQKNGITQNYYKNKTDSSGGGVSNPGGLYGVEVKNEGNASQDTEFLHTGGTISHLLQNDIQFRATKIWLDNHSTNRPNSVLHLYRVAEGITPDGSPSLDPSSVVQNGNIRPYDPALYPDAPTEFPGHEKEDVSIIDVVLSYDFSQSAPEEGVVRAYMCSSASGTFLVDEKGQPIGIINSQRIVTRPNGVRLGILHDREAYDNNPNYLPVYDNTETSVIGIIDTTDNKRTFHPITNGGIGFDDPTSFDLTYLITNFVDASSAVSKYDSVSLPTEIPAGGSFKELSDGVWIYYGEDKAGNPITTGDGYTIVVGSNADSTMNGDDMLPMYDPEGHRYVYYALEVMTGGSAGQYDLTVSNDTSYRLDTQTAAELENLLLNGAVATNKRSEIVEVTAAKRFDARAIQNMPDETTVKFVLKQQVEGSDEWTDFYLDTPLYTDGHIDTTRCEPVTMPDGTVKYRRIAVLSGFRGEEMEQEQSFLLDKYDADGKERSFHWVETEVIMKEGDKTSSAQDPDGFEANTTITMTGDAIGPGISGSDSQHTSLQFEVSYETDNNKTIATNKLVNKTRVRVQKTWEGFEGVKQDADGKYYFTTPDGQKIPMDATFALFRKDHTGKEEEVLGEDGSQLTLTINGDSNGDDSEVWTWLDRFDPEGYEYTYIVKELSGENSGYWYSNLEYSKDIIEADIPEDGGKRQVLRTIAKFTNAPLEGDALHIDVSKQWLDDGDLNCRRPVRMTLFDAETGLPAVKNDGTPIDPLVLSEQNNWQSHFHISTSELPDGKHSSEDYFVLETAMQSTDNIDWQEVDYAVQPDLKEGPGSKPIIDYLREAQSGHTLPRVEEVFDPAFFSDVEEEILPDQYAKLQGHLAGHLNYTSTDESHYYNVFIGCNASATEYVFYNQRTGVVDLEVTKTWNDGGEYRSAILKVSRNGNFLGYLALTGDGAAADGNFPQTASKQKTWRSDDEDVKHPPVALYGESILKPSKGYPKYNSMGSLVTYTIEEVNIGGTIDDVAGPIHGGTDIPEDATSVRINSAIAGAAPDTYYVTSSMRDDPTFGDVQHSGDRYSWSITNTKSETYPLTINKVWQDGGTSALNQQGIFRRPDIYFQLYRTTASLETLNAAMEVVANDPSLDHNSPQALGKALAAITQVTVNGTDTPISIEVMDTRGGWDTKQNDWYWTDTALTSMPRYDQYGNPYVYFLTEGMNSNTEIASYHTVYYNANRDDLKDAPEDQPVFTPNIKGSSSPETLSPDVFIPSGNRWADGKAGPYSDYMSPVALIVSDGRHAVRDEEKDTYDFLGYWSRTVINYRRDTTDRSGYKVWKFISGVKIPDELLPDLNITLYRSLTPNIPLSVLQNLGEPVSDGVYEAAMDGKTVRIETVPYPENGGEGHENPALCNAASNFAYRFDDLPAFDDYGRKYYYYVGEATVEGSGATLEGFTAERDDFNFALNNTYNGRTSASLNIQKAWAGFGSDGTLDGKELPKTTIFAIQAYMPVPEDTPGAQELTFDGTTRTCLALPALDYTLTLETAYENGVLQSVTPTVKGKDGLPVTKQDAGGNTVSIASVKKIDSDSWASWSIQIEPIRSIAPNGQKMLYRVVETNTNNVYDVTAEVTINTNPDDPNGFGGLGVEKASGANAAARAANFFGGLVSRVRAFLRGEATYDTPKAEYTNTYNGGSMQYTAQKSWQNDTSVDKNKNMIWDESSRRTAVTLVLCRKWQDNAGTWLNEVVTEGTAPVTLTLTEDNSWKDVKTGLHRYAPNGNPYIYFTIEDPNEAPSYVPKKEETVTFVNLPDGGYTYPSSNGKTISIVSSSKWNVSASYADTTQKLTDAVTKNQSDTMTNVLPLTKLSLVKTWKYQIGDADPKPLDKATAQTLYDLGELPEKMHLNLEHLSGNDWAAYSTYVFNYSLIYNGALNTNKNYEKITDSIQVPKYEAGCNGRDDGCTTHKLADYRFVEELEYTSADKGYSFPNNETKTADANDYTGAFGTTGAGSPIKVDGTRCGYESTVTRIRNADGSIENAFTNTLPVRPLQVEKNWEDDTNKDGIRPSTLKISVYRDVTGTFTADADGVVSYTGDLPKPHTVTLSYGNAADTAKNCWHAEMLVPLYKHTYTDDADKYSLYLATEGESLNTLIQSNGTSLGNGKFGTADTPYYASKREAKHTDNDVAALKSVGTNCNYFIFTNKRDDAKRVTLQADKTFAGDAGWADLTRPTIHYTLQYLSNPKDTTPVWEDADNTDKTVTGEVKIWRTDTWETCTGEEEIVPVDAATGKGGVTWEANRFYPKAVADAAGQEIQYRVVEQMYAGTVLLNETIRPYTPSSAEQNFGTADTTGKKTAAITNTLRTVPLDILKSWAGTPAHTALPDSVTYLVEYRLAEEAADGSWDWVADSEWIKAPLGEDANGLVTLEKLASGDWKKTLNLPLFDKNGDLFVYRVSEQKITYGDLTYEAVSEGFEANILPYTSSWEGTIGGYAGSVITTPTLDADNLPTHWYASSGATGSENINTFMADTALVLQKKVAAKDLTTFFGFTVKVTLPADASRTSYPWTIDCAYADHGVSHDHTAADAQPLHGEATPTGNTLTLSVKLGHGDTLYLHDLPEGSTYSVTEADAAGYAVSFTGDGTAAGGTVTGTLGAVRHAAVTCINHRASLAVLKIDGSDSPLPGAGFSLLKDGTATATAESTLAQKITFPADDANYDAETNRYYRDSEKKEYTVHREGTGLFYYKPLTEDEKAEYNRSGALSNGNPVVAVAEFENLQPTTYLLQETFVPDGYLCPESLANGIEVTVPDPADPSAYDISYQVTNFKGMELPTTGAGGFRIPVAVGLALFLLSALLLFCLCSPKAGRHTKDPKKA